MASYKNPEVKHELILYGELAAVAAGIVALYLLALVPFAHIQRVQLLTARLKPNGLEMADADRFVKLANDSLFQEDSEVNKFQYRLTKRPCGSKDDIGLQTDQKCGSTKDAQIYQVKNMIKAKFVAYQDFSQIFTIQCCHPEKTAPLCPCGIPYRHGKWCFELLNPDQTCQEKVTEENFQTKFGFENLQQILKFDQKLSLCSNSTQKVNKNCEKLHGTFGIVQNQTTKILCGIQAYPVGSWWIHRHD